MSFETSLDTLLSNLVWAILTPPWLMSKSYSIIRKQELILVEHLPFEGARKAHEPFVN